MVIRHYLAEEITKTTLGVVLILLFIGLSNEFVVYLAKAASGDLPAALVLKLVFYNVPLLLGILIPLGFFIGMLMSYGRMYADSEMTVLIACGTSPWQLMRIALLPGLGFMLIAAFLNLWFNPIALTQQATLIAQAETDVLTRALIPGRFQESDDGQTILFVEYISDDRENIEDIFIAQQPGTPSVGGISNEWSVVVSEQGFEWTDPETRQNYIVLTEGSRYAGIPGQADFSLTEFGEYGIRIQNADLNIEPESATRDTWTLIQSQDLGDKFELQWRIALVVAVLVVVILAVPLSQVRPRQGKYANLFVGIVVIIIYCNALVLGRIWLRDGIIPLALGFWWIHAIALGFGLCITLWRLGYHRRLRQT